MSHSRNTDFLREALNLNLIDVSVYNEMFDRWRKDPSKDCGLVLLNEKKITKHDYDKIFKKIVANSEGDIKSDGDRLIYSKDFCLEGFLGHGGVGRVFLAFDENIKRKVAIKELYFDKESANKKRLAERFLREARLSGQLEHPGIIPIYELKQKNDGSFFYVMKHVEGESLVEAIGNAESKTPEESFRNRIKLLDKFISLCEAVGYAHSKGVIHRDLKPSNVILGKFGETILLDWGLAKRIDQSEQDDDDVFNSYDDAEADAELTRQGAKVGTPSYMSPEQIDGKLGDVDRKSDVYSLGIVLFMVLTGKRPFSGTGDKVMKEKIEANDVPSAMQCGDFIPPELDAICKKAISKDKKNRFEDAGVMADELKAYRDGRLVSIYAYSRKDLFKRFLARNKVVVAAAMVVFAAIIAGSIFSFHYAAIAAIEKGKAENALVNVTQLSESAMRISRHSVERAENYFHNLTGRLDSFSAYLGRYNLLNKSFIENSLKEFVDDAEEVSAATVYPSPGEIKFSFYDKGFEPQILDIDYDKIVSEFKEKGSVVVKVVMGDGTNPVLTVNVPVFGQYSIKGVVSAATPLSKIISEALDFDPLKSDFQVWCMNQNGVVLYDENPTEVGKNLFTDEMYKKFPELKNFGEKMLSEKWGVGHYEYYDRGGKQMVYKVAAWDTISSEDGFLKIVVTQPYSQ